jgi:hypothetical protein
MPVRLILKMAIILVVPFIASLLLDVVSFLSPVFKMVVSISIVDNVTQVPVIPISFLVTLLWGNETVGRVPTWALAVVRVLTLRLISIASSDFRGPLFHLSKSSRCGTRGTKPHQKDHSLKKKLIKSFNSSKLISHQAQMVLMENF